MTSNHRLWAGGSENSLSTDHNNHEPTLNRHKSEEERRIRNIVEELKLFELKQQEDPKPTKTDQEAAESLILLGAEQTPPPQTPFQDRDVVDALLTLSSPPPPMAPPSDFKATVNGTNGPGLSDVVGDLPAWLLKDISDGVDPVLPVEKGAKSGKTPERLDELSSPTKAHQLLSSIILETALASKAQNSAIAGKDPPDRCVSVPARLQTQSNSISNNKPHKSVDDVDRASSTSDMGQFYLERQDSASTSSAVDGEKLDIGGQLLLRVQSADLAGVSEPHIFVSDVFQTFFTKRHWDEFRSILERNDINCTAVRPTGYQESVETISVSTLHRLLVNNQARRDGFVRSVPLASIGRDDPVADAKVIAAQEVMVGELSSGIRTRNQDLRDISYVEVEGVHLPSITARDGTQYVRLVDLQQILYPTQVDLERQHASHALLKRLKMACSRLGITVQKCSGNEKSRMVVYAHSFRSNSLHVISIQDLTLLINGEKERLIYEHNREELKRSRSGDGEWPVLRKRFKRDFSPSSSVFTDDMSSESEDETSSIISSGITSPTVSRPPSRFSSVSVRSSADEIKFHLGAPEVLPSPPASVHPGSRGGRLTGPEVLRNFPASSARTRPGPVMGVAKFPPKRSPLYGTLRPVQVPTVPLCDAVVARGCNLNKIDSTKLEQCRPCAVVLQQSKPLWVFVGNEDGARGQMGCYFDHLFKNQYTPCIRCQLCREYFAVGSFVKHRHPEYYGVISRPRIMLFARHLKSSRFDLWRSFNRKLAIFGHANLAFDLCGDFGQIVQARKSVVLGTEKRVVGRTQEPKKERPPIGEEQKLTRPPLFPIRPNKRCAGDASRHIRSTESRTADFALWTIGGSGPNKEALIEKWFGEQS